MLRQARGTSVVGESSSSLGRPFMVRGLGELVTGFPQLANVQVYPVEDYDIFYHQPHPILKRITTPRRCRIFHTFRRLAQESQRRHRMFIAEKEGKPVGTTIVFFDDLRLLTFTRIPCKRRLCDDD